MEKAKDYNWYGNIRELENFVERISVFLQYHDNRQDIEQLVDSLTINNTQNFHYESVNSVSNESQDKQFYSRDNSGEIDLDQWEINNILDALKKNNLSIQKAADSLGVSRTTLWRKMKKYNINTN